MGDAKGEVEVTFERPLIKVDFPAGRGGEKQGGHSWSGRLFFGCFLWVDLIHHPVENNEIFLWKWLGFLVSKKGNG